MNDFVWNEASNFLNVSIRTSQKNGCKVNISRLIVQSESTSIIGSCLVNNFLCFSFCWFYSFGLTHFAPFLWLDPFVTSSPVCIWDAKRWASTTFVYRPSAFTNAALFRSRIDFPFSFASIRALPIGFFRMIKSLQINVIERVRLSINSH